MNKSLRNGIIVLVILFIGYYFISHKQNSLNTQSSDIFTGDVQDIHKVLIQKSGEALELAKEADEWTISGNDTLVIRQNRIDDLFNTVLAVKQETLVSEKQENWSKYSVDDSTGTHLALIDAEDNTIAYFVFGNSRSDYSHNYIRVKDSDKVFLTDKNIMYHLSTTPTFWGEVPKEEAADVPESTEIPDTISSATDTSDTQIPSGTDEKID